MENKHPETREETKKLKKSQEKKNGKYWVKKFFQVFFSLIVVGILAGAGLFFYYAKDAPEITQADLESTYSSELVDIHGNVFYTLGGERREASTLDEYNQTLIDAVLSTEDQQFYKHFGINPVAIARAAFGYVLNRGTIVGGGSTITQQLVKNSVFSTLKSDQTLERKAKEAWLAMKIEREYSKDQILIFYLNKIHMGGNIYGMATAAEQYYGKSPSELELNEAALLAGMPQAPNYYNPYTNPEAATKRRNQVLNAMVRNKKITKKEAEKAKKIPIEEGLVELVEKNENNLVFDGYLTAVLKEIEEKTDFDPYLDGLRIETNLDMDVQQTIYDIANTDEYVAFVNDEIQTAISVIEPETGKALGILGGRNQEGQLSENRALSNSRSIGSTIKPIMDYGPAIEFNKYSTYHLVEDEPYEKGDWKPQNYDRKFRGELTLREALVDSRNTVAARIFNEELNRGEVESFLTNLGIDPTKITPGSDGLVPSSAINGNISPYKLAAAYAAFANGGNYTEPYTISKIVTPDGEEIDLTPETNKAMEDYTAYMITDMLKGVPQMWGDMNISGVYHAGKTGTTNYTDEQHAEHNIPAGGAPDTWYVGYSKNFSISIWAGYDEPFKPGHYVTFDDGSMNLPRKIFVQAMAALSANVDNSDWQRPSSVVSSPVYKGSKPAELPSKNTPDDKIVHELFVKGTEPTKVHEGADDKELPAPSGLEARYSASDDRIYIQWNEFEDFEDTSIDPEYVLNINGKEQVIDGTSFEIDNPSSGSYKISLYIRRGKNNKGKPSTLTLSVNKPSKPTEEENEEENESEPDENEEEKNEEENR